jgi:hypothetical protein
MIVIRVANNIPLRILKDTSNIGYWVESCLTAGLPCSTEFGNLLFVKPKTVALQPL